MRGQKSSTSMAFPWSIGMSADKDRRVAPVMLLDRAAAFKLDGPETRGRPRRQDPGFRGEPKTADRHPPAARRPTQIGPPGRQGADLTITDQPEIQRPRHAGTPRLLQATAGSGQLSPACNRSAGPCRSHQNPCAAEAPSCAEAGFVGLVVANKNRSRPCIGGFPIRSSTASPLSVADHLQFDDLLAALKNVAVVSADLGRKLSAGLLFLRRETIVKCNAEGLPLHQNARMLTLEFVKTLQEARGRLWEKSRPAYVIRPSGNRISIPWLPAMAKETFRKNERTCSADLPLDDCEAPSEPQRESRQQRVQALIYPHAIRPAGDFHEGSIEVQEQAGPGEQIMRW